MKNEFIDQLRILSDEELIERFNQDVGHNGWVSAREKFLEAMRRELLKRFDCSNVIKDGSMSMAHKIKIEDGKLIQLI